MILSGNTNGIFQQQYINTAPVTWLSGGTGGADAYQAFIPTVWYGPSGLFSSPNGAYSMAVSALVNTNSESQFYTQALIAVNTNYGGNFYGTQSNMGLFNLYFQELNGIPSVWLGDIVGGYWGVNAAVSSLIINNNGAVQALNSGGNVIWQNSSSSGANAWSNEPIVQNTGSNVVGYLGANASPPMTSLTNLTPTQLLGSNPVFTASGTYSSTTYTGSGTLYYGPTLPLTSSQLSQCGLSSVPTAKTTPEQEISAPRLMNVSHTSNSQAAHPTMMYASYTPEFNQPQFMKVQYDVRRDANGRIISRTDDQRPAKEQDQNNRNNPPAQLKPNTENSDLKRGPQIFTKISLPYRLSDNEFYANKDAVVKATLTRGDNLTTALRFSPGPQQVMSDPKIIKKFRMKVLEKKVFTKK